MTEAIEAAGAAWARLRQVGADERARNQIQAQERDLLQMAGPERTSGDTFTVITQRCRTLRE